MAISKHHHCKTCRCSKKRIFIFDSPRTCPLLFHRLFENHPDIQQCLFPFADSATLGPDRVVGYNNKDNDHFQEESYARAWERMSDWISETENADKIPWIKEHAVLLLKPSLLEHQSLPTKTTENPTILPDAFFWSLTPIILIRHPALSIPSYYREQLRFLNPTALETYTTNRFTRMIFDAYCAKRHSRARADRAGMPIVIDVKNLVWRTEETVGRLCDVLGIGKENVRFEWEREGERGNQRLMKLTPWFSDDTFEDEGDEDPAEDDIDLDQEQEKWTDEFGEDAAKELRRLVEKDLPNYEYLKKYEMMAMQKGPRSIRDWRCVMLGEDP